MIGIPYNPDNCIFISSQALNAGQFNPNVPDTGNLTTHNLLWDTVANSFIWVDTKTNLITLELAAGGGGGGGLMNVVFVSKNGNDGTGDGTSNNPFLTVQAGIDFAYTLQDASTRPAVFVMPGTYNENCVLKANVLVRGLGFNATKVVGNWTIDSTFSPVSTDLRSGFSDIGIFGNVTIDFAAVTSSDGKIYSVNTRFASGNIVMTAFSSVNQFLMQGGDFFGPITLNGLSTILDSANDQSGGAGITINSISTQNTAFTTVGGSISNIVINITHNRLFAVNLGHAIQEGSTLSVSNTTVNPALPDMVAVSTSLPIDADIIYGGIANITNIVRTNNPNLSVPPPAIVSLSTPATYVIGSTEQIIFVNALANPITVKLPDPKLRRKIKIKVVAGSGPINNLNIQQFATETIEGVAATNVLGTSSRVGIEIQSDGTNYWFLNRIN